MTASLVRTIAHISDLHFGRIDRPVADALVADLSRHPPDLLVISGDFTQRARRRQYAQAAAYLRRLPRPQIVVPGNHDIPLWDVTRRFLFPLNRYRQYIATELFPTFQDDELFVLGVNTARSFTRTSGWIDRVQMQEIQRRFSAAPTNLFKILVTHHPFIASPRDPHGDVVRGAGKALVDLEHCGVDMLLAGHLHLAYHDDVRAQHQAARRSVLSIQAGTATSTRRRREPNAYNWITISPELVTVAVRAWNGSRLEESLATRYERANHQWKRLAQVPADPAAAQALHAPAASQHRE